MVQEKCKFDGVSMKIKKFLTFCGTLFILTGSLAAQASVLGQAGDIAAGASYELNAASGIASYYKNGTSGKIRFDCNLNGTDVKAMLYPGKNFAGNPAAILEAGMNGPYEWNLSDMGDDAGNIKVKLIKGDSAVVQCRQIV
jgi:hypothetical protein